MRGKRIRSFILWGGVPILLAIPVTVLALVRSGAEATIRKHKNLLAQSCLWSSSSGTHYVRQHAERRLRNLRHGYVEALRRASQLTPERRARILELCHEPFSIEHDLLLQECRNVGVLPWTDYLCTPEHKLSLSPPPDSPLGLMLLQTDIAVGFFGILCLEAIKLYEVDDSRGAMQTIFAALGFIQNYVHGGRLIDHRSLVICERLAFVLLKRVACRTREGLSSNSADLRIMMGDIEVTRPSIDHFLRAEDLEARRDLLFVAERGLALEKLGTPRDPVWRRNGSTSLFKSLVGERAQIATGLENFERYYARLAELCHQPISRRQQLADMLDKETLGWGNFLNPSVVPCIRAVFEEDALSIKQRGLGRIGLAIASFRSARRAFPESLESLIPDYLENLPRCPMSGREYVYESQAGRLQDCLDCRHEGTSGLASEASEFLLWQFHGSGVGPERR